VIRVYDAAGKVIEAQERAGNFKGVVSTLALPSFVFGLTGYAAWESHHHS